MTGQRKLKFWDDDEAYRAALYREPYEAETPPPSLLSSLAWGVLFVALGGACLVVISILARP